MKKAIYNLMSIPIALGFLVFLRSAYCLIDSFRVIGNPFKTEFWDNFIESFQDFSLIFRSFSILIFFAIIILLQNGKIKRAFIQEFK